MPDRERLTILHAELWGSREQKYKTLSRLHVGSTDWKILTPESDSYLFIPKDEKHVAEYECGWLLTAAMPSNGVGFVTARDAFAMDFDNESLRERIAEFRDSETRTPAAVLQHKYGLKDTSSWNLIKARERVRNDPDWETHFTRCLYRPFDFRNIYFSNHVLERPVLQIQRHLLLKENIGLVTTRQTRDEWGALATGVVTGHKAVAAYDINSIFPLYEYSSKEADLFTPVTDASKDIRRRANFRPEFLADFSTRLGLKFVPDGTGDRMETFGPEDVFHYMYAVFYSPAYRKRYAEFLKLDFPRLPLTTNVELFRELCSIGAELTDLHLVKKHAPLLTRYPVAGDNVVEKLHYTAPGQGATLGRVWINGKQYFEGVPLALWQLHIGGYQVLEKWLKDRKGLRLTYDDLTHYQYTVAALHRTMELMGAVDQAIERHGGWPFIGSVRP